MRGEPTVVRAVIADDEPLARRQLRDLLADVATVMAGTDRVRSAEVLRRLADRWPDAYGGWSAQRFAAELGDEHVSIRPGRIDGQAGQRYVPAAVVAEVLERRAEQDDDSDEER